MQIDFSYFCSSPSFSFANWKARKTKKKKQTEMILKWVKLKSKAQEK